MDIVSRAKNLLLQPRQEWGVIAGETHTVQGLFTGYVMILAAIPAVAQFIGFSIIGYAGFRLSVGVGLAHMVVAYVLSLASVYVLGLVIDNLAPHFGSEKNFGQAIKVAAFAPTAAWLAGIFYIHPILSILGIVGLYSLFLLYVGLPLVMKTPEDKAMGYTVVVIILTIVLWVVFAALASTALPGRIRGF